MSNPTECPFCMKLADPNGWPAADIVWNFPHSVAVLGPWQFYTGYCVLISREHATELGQLRDRTAFLDEMVVLSGAIDACFAPHKMNYELLGNLVPHVHWHLFPRSLEDPDRLRPVWFAFEKAETDFIEKDRLETGSVPRPEAVRQLRECLRSMDCPTG